MYMYNVDDCLERRCRKKIVFSVKREREKLEAYMFAIHLSVELSLARESIHLNLLSLASSTVYIPYSIMVCREFSSSKIKWPSWALP